MNNKTPLPEVDPESAGFSKERLARLKPAMRKYIDLQLLPHIVTLVAREGKIVHFAAQGYQDCESKIPATRDTIFRLYSNSKAITGAAAMILYEEGRLTLDDPVSRYIPAFKDPLVAAAYGETGRGWPPVMFPTVPAQREITLRDCLRNTTGLATPERSPYWYAVRYKDIIPETGWDLTANLDNPPTQSYRHRVENHARLPLNFQPGTDFVYHVGYPVIGAVIEIITGQTLEEFYRERIFQPLGMKDTSFYLAEHNRDRFADCYRPKQKNGRWGIAPYDKAAASEKARGPAVNFGAGGDMGGVLSTAGDYARFCQMLLNGGELDGVRILGRKSVEIMTASHTGDIFLPMRGRGFGFGMGVGVYVGGAPRPVMRSVGTYGWDGAAGTLFFADPKEKLLGICFTQVIGALAMPGNDYQEEFERLVYQALV
ncbi:MAG: serine hydrolase domain-containing protein [Dehalococcoidales bacterium]|jgi:CubicO group peptidase (beta-lactamase class C family)